MTGKRAALTSHLSRRRGDSVLLAVYVIGVIGWAGLRYHTFVGTAVPAGDTQIYRDVAAASIWSGHFWAGGRPWGTPLLYKLISSDSGRIRAQFLIADICWLALAVAATRAMSARLVKVAVFAFVLGFSLLPIVTQWEPDLLSDSLSLSLTVLMLAAWLELVRAPNWPRAIAVLVISLFWGSTRDDHAYVLLFTAPLIAVTLWRVGHRWIKIALVAGTLLIAGLTFTSADVGVRWFDALRITTYTRLVKDPTAMAYLSKRLPGGDWGTPKARRVYLEFLITHPAYTLTAPFSNRKTDSYVPGRPSYEAVLAPNTKWYDSKTRWFRPVLPRPIVDALYVPNAIATALIAILVAVTGMAFAIAGRAKPVWAVPTAGLILFYPHTLMVWHAAAADLDRHSLVSAITLRLSTLLLAAFIVDAALRRDDRPRSASRQAADQSPSERPGAS